jgi:F1F0 ATPase subunit 2
MSLTWFDGLPSWGLHGWLVIPILAAHFAAGIGLGACYFGGLWWNACLFASGARLVAAIGLIIGRFVLLAGVLTLASLEGALPLLLMALGVVLARPLVMRRVKATAR